MVAHLTSDAVTIPFFTVPRFRQGQWSLCRAIEQRHTVGYAAQTASRSCRGIRGLGAVAIPVLSHSHVCGPWHGICLQNGADVANHPSLHHRFHVVTAHHCALLLNKDKFEGDIPAKPILVSAKKKKNCTLEGMVAGHFRRLVGGGCHHFTIMSVHMNNRCASRLSVRLCHFTQHFANCIVGVGTKLCCLSKTQFSFFRSRIVSMLMNWTHHDGNTFGSMICLGAVTTEI